MRGLRCCCVVILILIGAFVPTRSRAQWRVIKEKDSMTDKMSAYASVTNSAGYELRIERTGTDSLSDYATFILPSDSSDRLGERPPIFRVDDNKAFDLDDNRATQQREDDYIGTMSVMERASWGRTLYYRADYHSVTWRLFHPSGCPVCEFLAGRSLLFRYYLPNETRYVETRFTLAGATKAITRVRGN